MKRIAYSLILIIASLCIAAPSHAGILDWLKAKKAALTRLHGAQQGQPSSDTMREAISSLPFVEYGCWDSDGEGATGPHKTAGQVLYKKYTGKNEDGTYAFEAAMGKDFCKGDYIFEYHCDKYKANPDYWIISNDEPFFSKSCPLWTKCIDATCQPICTDSDGDDFEKKGSTVKYFYDDCDVKPGTPLEDTCNQGTNWLVEQVCTAQTGEIATIQVDCEDYKPGHICNDGRCIPCGGPDPDGDGIGNDCDNCPGVVTGNLNDSDGDGIGDVCDNCVYISNPHQLTKFGGPVGDECNCDEDGDGIITEEFKDPDFLMVIREVLGKGPTDDIMLGDVLDIKELMIKKVQYSGSFKDISGIQCMANLEEFIVIGYPVENITPLSNLLGLTHVQLSEVAVSDLSPLKSLHDLKMLFISKIGSMIIDLEQLSGLKKLEVLSLHGIILNLAKIAEFKKLRYLTIGDQNFSNLNAFKDLKELKELSVHDSNVSDLSPINGLNKLFHLEISWANISDLTPLKKSKNISYLTLSKNKISDIDAVGDLNFPILLLLPHNSITDIAPICKNSSSLSELRLDDNNIEDLTPFMECVFASKHPVKLRLNNNPLGAPYLAPLVENLYFGKMMIHDELHLSSDQINETVKGQIEKLKAKGVIVYVDDELY